MILVPDAGALGMLLRIVNRLPPQDLMLRLYTNDHEPSKGDTAANYTEASGFGYAAILLAGANWAPFEGFMPEVRHPQEVFTFTGPLGRVFGYYLTWSGSVGLAWAERFPRPFIVQQDGDQIRVTPLLQRIEPQLQGT